MQIKVKGLASGRVYPVEALEGDYPKNLLDWLREKKFTIASSCGGEGVCKKCSIQNDWLTCELTLKEFLERQPDGIIEVAYL